MKRLVPMLAAAMLAGCGAPSSTSPAAAAAPSLRLSAIPGRPGAGYFEIEVPAEQGALLAVSSPQVGRIEMHETIQQGTMSTMRPVARLLPENGRVLFQPGGRHLMLYEIDPRLTPGGTAQFVLRFEHGQARTLDATVAAPGADPGR